MVARLRGMANTRGSHAGLSDAFNSQHPAENHRWESFGSVPVSCNFLWPKTQLGDESSVEKIAEISINRKSGSIAQSSIELIQALSQ